MKLNLGCGRDRREGYVNVDSAPACEPDVVFDLETRPWPWADNSVEEALFHHSLEHLGGDPKVFIGLMQELYRVCAPGAVVKIAVPHPRHDDFIGDPTHVRPITPDVLSLFDRRLNERWKSTGASSTPLALYADVDFAKTRTEVLLDEPYASELARGELSQQELNRLLRSHNNVAREYRFELTVRK